MLDKGGRRPAWVSSLKKFSAQIVELFFLGAFSPRRERLYGSLF